MFTAFAVERIPTVEWGRKLINEVSFFLSCVFFVLCSVVNIVMLFGFRHTYFV